MLRRLRWVSVRQTTAALQRDAGLDKQKKSCFPGDFWVQPLHRQLQLSFRSYDLCPMSTQEAEINTMRVTKV